MTIAATLSSIKNVFPDVKIVFHGGGLITPTNVWWKLADINNNKMFTPRGHRFKYATFLQEG